MTRQIAVRLPDDVVEFLDEQVRDGEGASRASVVADALNRERRRRTAAKDAAILAGSGDDADMNSLAKHVARKRLNLA
jgi:Arc/MetJ-type ribon-helix-helix transcriptional regulator